MVGQGEAFRCLVKATILHRVVWKCRSERAGPAMDGCLTLEGRPFLPWSDRGTRGAGAREDSNSIWARTSSNRPLSMSSRSCNASLAASVAYSEESRATRSGICTTLVSLEEIEMRENTHTHQGTPMYD